MPGQVEVDPAVAEEPGLGLERSGTATKATPGPEPFGGGLHHRPRVGQVLQ